LDQLENRARIREIIQEDSDLPTSVADAIAFHLTDWLDDLAELYAFMQNPQRVGNEEARKLLMGFLIHVPNHLAAASKLWLDIPVTDVFEVGALNETEE
jgi:hypothetical protein